MKFYLSGPMTGLPHYNYPLFNRAAERLREAGNVVVNPAENFGGDTTLTRGTYLRQAVSQVAECTCIVMLPGWEASEGAKLELAVAKASELFTLEYLERDESEWTVVPLEERPSPRARVEPLTTWAEAETGLLEAAQKIVHGDRQRTYGHPAEHHTRTAAMWSAFLGHEIKPDDVALMFVIDKLSRTRGQSKPDTILDIAGYAQVHAMVRAAQERGEA